MRADALDLRHHERAAGQAEGDDQDDRRRPDDEARRASAPSGPGASGTGGARSRASRGRNIVGSPACTRLAGRDPETLGKRNGAGKQNPVAFREAARDLDLVRRDEPDGHVPTPRPAVGQRSRRSASRRRGRAPPRGTTSAPFFSATTSCTLTEALGGSCEAGRRSPRAPRPPGARPPRAAPARRASPGRPSARSGRPSNVTTSRWPAATRGRSGWSTRTRTRQAVRIGDARDDLALLDDSRRRGAAGCRRRRRRARGRSASCAWRDELLRRGLPRARPASPRASRGALRPVAGPRRRPRPPRPRPLRPSRAVIGAFGEQAPVGLDDLVRRRAFSARAAARSPRRARARPESSRCERGRVARARRQRPARRARPGRPRGSRARLRARGRSATRARSGARSSPPAGGSSVPSERIGTRRSLRAAAAPSPTAAPSGRESATTHQDEEQDEHRDARHEGLREGAARVGSRLTGGGSYSSPQNGHHFAGRFFARSL